MNTMKLKGHFFGWSDETPAAEDAFRPSLASVTHETSWRLRWKFRRWLPSS